MSILEALFYVIGFFVVYGISVSVVFLIDLRASSQRIIGGEYWNNQTLRVSNGGTR